MAIFELQPPEEKLDQWALKYWEKNSKSEEAEAFEAGRKIAEGDFSKENLAKIIQWKTPRVVPLFRKKNDEEKVRGALEKAIANKAVPAQAIRALTGLSGVGVPVASAIPTTIFPDRYTVIDFRALQSLGHMRDEVDFYERYLAFCLECATAFERRGILHRQQDCPAPTALRAFDRALWQWSESDGDLESK